MAVTLEDVAQRINAGDVEAAVRNLDAFEVNEQNRSELLFLRGYLKERLCDLEGAFSTYEKVLEQEPDHAEALFRSALLADLCGDDERAVQLYEKCAADEPVHVNSLLNLAVLYEEGGRLAEAATCVERVLAEHPAHSRARRLRRSIEASRSMHYDEKIQRDREKHSALLDIPISDFELSVRSRNCLKQMNIISLGDLLRATEEDLLSYKNFGETSLNEIKIMLSQNGLKIGQAAVEGPKAPLPTAPADSPPSGINVALLHRPVTELGLSVRSRKCLQRLGVTTLGELVGHTEAELLATKNFGMTSLVEIKRELAEHGLSLRSPV